VELFWIWVWVLSGDLYTRGDLGRWVWLFSSTKSDMGLLSWSVSCETNQGFVLNKVFFRKKNN